MILKRISPYTYRWLTYLPFVNKYQINLYILKKFYWKWCIRQFYISKYIYTYSYNNYIYDEREKSLLNLFRCIISVCFFKRNPHNINDTHETVTNTIFHSFLLAPYIEKYRYIFWYMEFFRFCDVSVRKASLLIIKFLYMKTGLPFQHHIYKTIFLQVYLGFSRGGLFDPLLINFDDKKMFVWRLMHTNIYLLIIWWGGIRRVIEFNGTEIIMKLKQKIIEFQFLNR